MSRRGIRARYDRLTAATDEQRRPDEHHRPDEQHGPDVHEIALRAVQGEAAAAEAFRYAFDALGRALAPWIGLFGATAVVVGGSMAQSWNLVHPALTAGLATGERPDVPVLLTSPARGGPSDRGRPLGAEGAGHPMRTTAPVQAGRGRSTGMTARRAGGPTMHDVGRLAQVSAMTVSRVLKNAPGVSEATREKVFAAVEELGYRRNQTARSLRLGAAG